MKLTKYNFSDRDKKLIIMFMAFVVLFLAYRLVYCPNMQITKKLQKQVRQLKITETDLQLKNARADIIVKDNQKLSKEIKGIINRYGAGVTAQKAMIFFENLENTTGMKISSIGFAEPESITSVPQTQIASDTSSVPDNNMQKETGSSTENGSSADKETSASSGEVTADQSTALTEAAGSEKITGSNTVVSVDFEVDSNGLKKSIDYINNYSERMNIKELNVAYDISTGNLNGSMQINMYQLNNTGRKYEDPAIAGVDIGTQNYFGTINIPKASKK